MGGDQQSTLTRQSKVGPILQTGKAIG